MNTSFPPSVKATLWSYDTNKLDIGADKKRIITNVLNYGTMPAVEWLFKTYPRSEIKTVTAQPLPGEWNKRSLNLWATVFDIQPEIKTRFESV